MQIQNSQSKIGFGNLNIIKFEKVGTKTVEVALGEIHTTKKFNRDFLDICESSKLGGIFDLPESLSQKIEQLVDSVVTLPSWKGKPKMACYVGNEAEILDKNLFQDGGYKIYLKA